MDNEFKKNDDGTITWSFVSEEDVFAHNKLGNVGKTSYVRTINFTDSDVAMRVLEEDLSDVNHALDIHKKTMEENRYDKEMYMHFEPLMLRIGELNKSLSEINDIPEILYKENPKKYQKLYEKYIQMKKYIIEELSAINKEYEMKQAYEPAKKAHDLMLEEAEKITKRMDNLRRI